MLSDVGGLVVDVQTGDTLVVLDVVSHQGQMMLNGCRCDEDIKITDDLPFPSEVRTRAADLYTTAAATLQARLTRIHPLADSQSISDAVVHAILWLSQHPERFNAPVEDFDPFRAVSWDAKKLGGDAAQIASTAAVAIGLALRKAADR